MIQRRQEAEAEQERRQAEREAKERRMEAVMKTKERPAYFFSKKSRRAEQFQVAAGEAEAQRKATATAKISRFPHSQPSIQGEQPHKVSTKQRMRQMMRARLKMAVEPPSSTNEQLQSVTSVDYSRGSAPRQKASNRDLDSVLGQRALRDARTLEIDDAEIMARFDNA